jgi:hypothetical protein
MARTKANWLVTDLQREANRLQTVLEHLGRVTLHVDDPYLVQALGDLSQARDQVNAAVAKFERRGQDYDFRMDDPDGVKFRDHVARNNAYSNRREQDAAAGGRK